MSRLTKEANVAVVGAGTMGAGIAQVMAQAGHCVFLYDTRVGAAESGRNTILVSLKRQVEKGRISSAALDSVAKRLIAASSIGELIDTKLVVEAIVEKLDAKRRLFAALEEIVPQDAILATNTSSLSVTEIAAGLKRPERVGGLHFFNPAPVMKLVEIVAGLASDRNVLDTLFETTRSWGKVPVHVTSTPGFIVNRVARPFYAEALRLFEEGAADVVTIDAVMRESGGFRMGPFELMDLIGHDINSAVTRSVFEAYFADPRFRPSLAQQEMVAAGWLGRKTGRGFYHYHSEVSHPKPAAAERGPNPDSVVVEGDLGPAEPLVVALQATGLPVTRQEGMGIIRIPGARLALSDGRTATMRVAGGDHANLVLFDLALDYGGASRIAIAKADQATHAPLAAAAGLFQALGKTVSVIEDTPGLIVMRTLAMLANEAVEAVSQRIASPHGVDTAMTLGVNYPYGPLEWGDTLGAPRILAVLEALQAVYGDDRYRPSMLLRRRVASGQLLRGGSLAGSKRDM